MLKLDIFFPGPQNAVQEGEMASEQERASKPWWGLPMGGGVGGEPLSLIPHLPKIPYYVYYRDLLRSFATT